MTADCPFCARIAAGETTHRTGSAAAICDAFPVSPGHTLVVPLRHVADYFELGADEQHALMDLVNTVRASLDLERSPDGYNIGVNVGAAAGQTVGHVHVHVIPRYAGDAPDPRGGVRWVFPERARYW